MEKRESQKKDGKKTMGRQLPKMELIEIVKCSHAGYDSFSDMPSLFYKKDPSSNTHVAGFSSKTDSKSFKKLLKLQKKYGEFMVPGPFWISIWKRTIRTATGPMEDQHVEHMEESLDDIFSRLKDPKKNSISAFKKMKR